MQLIAINPFDSTTFFPYCNLCWYEPNGAWKNKLIWCTEVCVCVGAGGASPAAASHGASDSAGGSQAEHWDSETAVRARTADPSLRAGGRGQGHAG